MTNEQKDILECKIAEEGFYYCFVHYSNWEEINDKEFHEEKQIFLNARKKFVDYIKSKGIEILE